jgi:hypothetical protein
MRRPEIDGFVSVAPPANVYDFSFLAPCPSSGLIIHGTQDELVPEPSVAKLAHKLANQRNITVNYQTIAGANHLFTTRLDDLNVALDGYLGGISLERNLAPAG